MSKAVFSTTILPAHSTVPTAPPAPPAYTNTQRSFIPSPLALAFSHPAPMLAFLALLSLPALSLVVAQGDLSAANNVTDLEGTWSSNSAVSTGGVSRARRFAGQS